MPDETPRVRRAPIPDDVLLVVRGDELDAVRLRADASRFHRRYGAWGRFGLSGFLAKNDPEILALCESRLERFSTLVIYRRSDVQAAGIEIVPTFRTPHVTLAHPNLELLVAGLLTCRHRMLRNPYFE